MARPIILSNNKMLVGLNTYGLVHDLYYPYVGLENHASASSLRHKVGIWVDSKFSWLDDDTWEITQEYEANSLVGLTKATSQRMGISLEFHDVVAISENALIRNIHVINLNDTPREIRIFFHQVLQISESNRGDTALFVPDDHVILDYKGRRAFVIFAQDHSGNAFDQYSIGNFGIQGKEGTFKDAEDGNLSGNNIEHGYVDTVIRVSCELQAHDSYRVHYWIVAAMTNSDALAAHRRIKNKGGDYYLTEATSHWHDWLRPVTRKSARFNPDLVKPLISSLLMVKSHADLRGAIIASCDSHMLNYDRDYYSYCWPRDAAYNVLPFIEVGRYEEAKAYFEFARDVMHKDGYLLHKYLSDRSVGSSWHPALQRHHKELPIQEDETAITLYALYKYYKTSDDTEFVRNLYTTFIKPAARFMADFIDYETKLPHGSYDLWEERFGTSTYSTAVVYAALLAASEMAKDFEYPDDAIAWESVAEDIKQNASKFLYDTENKRLRKGFLFLDNHIENDETLDISSLYGALYFGLYKKDDEEVVNTLKAIESDLLNKSPVGGVGRYVGDHYHSAHAAYGGNPWILTTLWLAQIYIMYDRKDEARELVDWVLSKQSRSGILPEQLHPKTGEYLSVAPLIWSHEELARTILLM